MKQNTVRTEFYLRGYVLKNNGFKSIINQLRSEITGENSSMRGFNEDIVLTKSLS